jgi:hypothetical protein
VVVWAEAMAVALAVAVSMAAALAAVASMADSAVVAWHSMMVVSAAMDFVAVDSMIAISGAAASDSATRMMTTMTTTLTLIRMDMGMAITRMGIDMGITRTPPAMGTIKTTAVAMQAMRAHMAGTCNSIRCAADGLTIACRPQRSRAEVVAIAAVNSRTAATLVSPGDRVMYSGRMTRLRSRVRAQA